MTNTKRQSRRAIIANSVGADFSEVDTYQSTRTLSPLFQVGGNILICVLPRDPARTVLDTMLGDEAGWRRLDAFVPGVLVFLRCEDTEEGALNPDQINDLIHSRGRK